MLMHAGAARYHLAGLTERAQDVDAAARATAQATAEGVARPERMFHLSIAGFDA
jgi:hypothetical protein